jgi:putative transposase
MLIFGQRHLRLVLAEYVRHDNGRRPHRARDLPTPTDPTPLRTSTRNASRANRCWAA